TAVSDDGVQAGQIYAVTYDALGRPYDETIKYIPGGDRQLQHRYDRYGNSSQLGLVDGTTTTNNYSYNKLNQLSSATLAGAAVSLAYFANDDRQGVTLPGGVTRSYTYKTNGPIDTISVNGPGGQLGRYAYSYDNALNVSQLVDPDGTHAFVYDG